MRIALALASLPALARAQDVTYCSKAPQSGWPLCDASLANEVRAADAVARMPITDKYLALATNTKPLASLGLPGYNWVRAICCIHTPPTCSARSGAGAYFTRS